VNAPRPGGRRCAMPSSSRLGACLPRGYTAAARLRQSLAAAGSPHWCCTAHERVAISFPLWPGNVGSTGAVGLPFFLPGLPRRKASPSESACRRSSPRSGIRLGLGLPRSGGADLTHAEGDSRSAGEGRPGERAPSGQAAGEDEAPGQRVRTSARASSTCSCTRAASGRQTPGGAVRGGSAFRAEGGGVSMGETRGR